MSLFDEPQGGEESGLESGQASPLSSFPSCEIKSTTPTIEEVLLPNDYKYYQNNLDKNQFNLTLINCSILLVKLYYHGNDDVSINSSNLRFFILQILKRSKTSIQTLQVACFYLMKLIKSHQPHEEIISNPKHLFMGLIILASKFNQDANYSFKTWIKITGLDEDDKSKLQFLKKVEVTLLSQLDYRLYINTSVYENWCNTLLIFGYDFIKFQNILVNYNSRSELFWEEDEGVIQKKMSKWLKFFSNLNLSNFTMVQIKFMNYYLSQFDNKVFFINSLFDNKRKSIDGLEVIQTQKKIYMNRVNF